MMLLYLSPATTLEQYALWFLCCIYISAEHESTKACISVSLADYHAFTLSFSFVAFRSYAQRV